MLTRKQQELLLFIHNSMKETGISPSFDEMKDALALSSKSGIHRLITALEERGFIRRLPNRARALEVIRLPQGAFAPPNRSVSSAQEFAPFTAVNGLAENNPAPYISANPGNISASVNIQAQVKNAGIPVPLMGRIAAGVPIAAIQYKTDTIFCPSGLIGKGEHYALEIKGDSMVNAGILDNDIVIIRRADTATSGDIVVALIDDIEATLKYYHRKGNSVALEAANPAYETRIFGPDRVKVQGKLTGLLRHY